tara:strand:- start:81 stop:995 length:915 start_codon:yes stop_codon:yes gene_type:complete
VAESWNKGDVFLLPIDSTRVGLGQIVDVLQSELYVVIYANIWNASSPPCPQDAVGQEVLFASLTLDAKLHHGDWTVIGNVTNNLANIKLPLSKVRISGEMHIESHDGSWSRCATAEEAEQLRFRKTVAPVRLEKALKAHYGVLEPHPAYDDLRYDLVVDLARLGGDDCRLRILGALGMEELLRQLLNRLEQVGSNHEELYDTECRERMGNAVMDGFVRNKGDFVLADDFGLYATEANLAVKEALAEYITKANSQAAESSITDFHERLAAFQNSDVESDGEGSFYDDFFGHSAPDAFDSTGNVIE